MSTSSYVVLGGWGAAAPQSDTAVEVVMGSSFYEANSGDLFQYGRGRNEGLVNPNLAVAFTSTLF
jgi:hypothetical protein